MKLKELKKNLKLQNLSVCCMKLFQVLEVTIESLKICHKLSSSEKIHMYYLAVHKQLICHLSVQCWNGLEGYDKYCSIFAETVLDCVQYLVQMISNYTIIYYLVKVGIYIYTLLVHMFVCNRMWILEITSTSTLCKSAIFNIVLSKRMSKKLKKLNWRYEPSNVKIIGWNACLCV